MTATPSARGRNRRALRPSFRARQGRTNPRPHDPERYKARNAVERGLGWLKWWRRVATRYENLVGPRLYGLGPEYAFLVFHSCSCDIVTDKEISQDFLTLMNRDYCKTLMR